MVARLNVYSLFDKCIFIVYFTFAFRNNNTCNFINIH